ncbi:MAG: 4-hydroxy-tetrahydrodipicolinate reductase [Acidimicrobiia bacterium]
MKVGVSGAAGRMGRLISAALLEAEDLSLVALYAPGRRSLEVAGLASSDDPEVLRAAEVVVEVTTPEAVMDNAARWLEYGLHTVIGTSGFTAERLSELESLWGDGPPNCLVVPNFSVSAILQMHFSELAAPHFDGVEIIELHHEDKPDAPSGTSLATARRIAAVWKGDGTGRGEELVSGALGAEVEGVPIHSVRLAGLVAHQEVIFGAAGQTLTIRSDATSWESFMPGVLLAIRSVGGLSGVTVGLESLLGL